jgi:hypothetical protein
MGESKNSAFRVRFNRKLKLEFHGVNVTSDAGLIPYRELDAVFELTKIGGHILSDLRTGLNTQQSGACFMSRIDSWKILSSRTRVQMGNLRYIP